MLGLLYLIVAFALGWQLLPRLLPWVLQVPERTSLFGTAIPLPLWVIRWPAAWLVGTLLMNWTTFVFCNWLGAMQPWAVLGLAIVATAMLMWFNGLQRPAAFKPEAGWWRKLLGVEGAYLLVALLLASFIAWHTLMIKDGVLLIGNTVWSDFGPHLAVIRSFSWGDNFPPQYPHFPEGNIRYHFLFQFLVATLEKLGLPLDWAFNLPSILSLVAVFLLLYALAVAITGSRAVGVLTGAFFIFRSSFAFFTFAKDHLGGDLWQALWNVSLHIGKTQNEHWGLWAQNVYANQRHFAFSIGIMLLILMALLPLIQSAASEQTGVKARLVHWWRTVISFGGWWPQDWRRAVALGVLLGLIGFWNGAVVITALLILAVMTLFSRGRLEYAIIAVLAVLLATLQSRWFIGAGASAVSPTLFFGFLADQKTVAGVIWFVIELMGLFVPLFILGWLGALPAGRNTRGLTLAFFVPIVFALTVSLTTDINANHKFIMIATLLANIVVAVLVVGLWRSGLVTQRILAVVFTLFMTITGFVDLRTLYNMNQGSVQFRMDDPVTLWVRQHSKPGDVFLTDWATLHPVQFAGRPIYYGWPYYAWSAGYDTDTRVQIMKRIYGTPNPYEMRGLAQQAGIRYIVIDDAVRNNREYTVNEMLMARVFPLVFAHEKDHTLIFAVQ
ncbi:hypothetical protein [Chitinolyticbacter meiyuanensis]|uniref:hypothetical protein n=1 Tax=Chitinolyticbacter meiyuanensis TaxID=682798 RepID=UPI0011E5B5DF|nr:hypothetical protein [Chitinolyticbacter meiyuanensis]